MSEFKALKMIRTIEQEYYFCGTDGHFHKTIDVAERCHKKKSPNTLANTSAQRRKLFIAAIDKYLEGTTYAQIGREIGVSGQTVSGYVMGAFRLLCQKQDKLIMLPDGTISKLPYPRTYYAERPDWWYVKKIENFTRCLREDQIKPLIKKLNGKTKKPWFYHSENITADCLMLMTAKQIKSIPTTNK